MRSLAYGDSAQRERIGSLRERVHSPFSPTGSNLRYRWDVSRKKTFQTDPHVLEDVTRTTLEHYEARAESFRQGTEGHDVSQNIDALLTELDRAGPQRILDFGCGPGRDLVSFLERGHQPVALQSENSAGKSVAP